MKIFNYSIVLLILFSSCQSNTQNSSSKNTEQNTVNSNQEGINPKLFISTRTRIAIKGIETDSSIVSIINSDYFEVRLSSLADEAKFIARNNTINAYEDGGNFKFVDFTIANKTGKSYKFETNTDFLNFMSERGYDLVDQIKNKYSVDYTFKKK